MIVSSNITPFGDQESLEQLGARIRRERLRRNQTQSQAAKWARVSRSTYAKLEAGSGSVRLRVLARVLAQLGYAKGLVDSVPEMPPIIDFDAEARVAERQRARPGSRRSP